jgi:C-terminal processing protease CtpA/Prc
MVRQDRRLIEMSKEHLSALKTVNLLIATVAFLLVVCSSGKEASGQSLDFMRQQGRAMLSAIQVDIKRNYYDASFHGADIESRFNAADVKMKQAASINEILEIIANVVDSIEDSHTYFLPPSRTVRIEHGWQMQMIGDGCYVTAVQPGSNAEAAGLAPGDKILILEGTKITRANLLRLEYNVYLLGPRASMKMLIEKPDGNKKQMEVMAKVTEGKTLINLQTGMSSDTLNVIRDAQTEARLHRHRYYEIGDSHIIWKMPSFDLADRQVDAIIDKARGRKAVIIDLRGNGGGSEDTLLRLVGNFFDHDVKLGDLKRRKETKALISKTRGDRAFKGQLVVLVDSDSGSASELFARVIQIEKRGTVIGDHTAGKVMRAKYYDHVVGAGPVIPYGVSITDADIVMTDGKSLERAGVTPDELLIPTALDLATKLDPVLSRAAKIAGLDLSPDKAAALFPIEWRK